MNINKIYDVWKSRSVVNNVICDDSKSISYKKAKEIVDNYRKWIKQNQPKEPVLFYCEQSIEHALLLVALSFSGLSYALTASEQDEIKSIITGDTVKLNHRNKNIAHPELLASSEKNISVGNSYSRNSAYFKTSGSLGNSKIVIHNNTLLSLNSKNVLDKLPLNFDCRVIIPVPICHMYGYGAALIPSLLAGSNIMISKNVNIIKLKEIEKTFKPDVLFTTPPNLNSLIRNKTTYLDYKFVVSAGDCINLNNYPSIIKIFKKLYNLYGSTELGVIAIGEVKDNSGNLNDTVNSLPGVKHKIINNTLFVKHPYGFIRYLNTNKHESYFNTNDTAEHISNESFRISGRANLSVNREGRLIYFSEVERMIRKLDYIQEAVVTSNISDSKGGIITAICKANKNVTCDKIRKELKIFMPAYSIPSRVILVDKLPILANGKIDRNHIKTITTTEEG